MLRVAQVLGELATLECCWTGRFSKRGSALMGGGAGFEKRVSGTFDT